jgi:glycosyltransferase involved in cell wall biosynthesis
MTVSSSRISVIIPASNEAGFLPACLESLLASEPPGLQVEVVVVSNGSRDGTVAAALGLRGAFEAKGWTLEVLDLPQGNKLAALNAGDLVAQGSLRVYLDADVTISPRLLAGLAITLDQPGAAYASGQVNIQGRGLASRAYARLWARVPFMTGGVPGCGLFAVNAAGRARWGAWPQIIADDMYVRLHFAPRERHLVPEPYDWPIAEGLRAIIRVRRRQDRGVSEIASRFPDLLANEDKAPIRPLGLAGLCLRNPLAFLIYTGVALAVRARPADGTWSRAR